MQVRTLLSSSIFVLAFAFLFSPIFAHAQTASVDSFFCKYFSLILTPFGVCTDEVEIAQIPTNSFDIYTVDTPVPPVPQVLGEQLTTVTPLSTTAFTNSAGVVVANASNSFEEYTNQRFVGILSHVHWLLTDRSGNSRPSSVSDSQYDRQINVIYDSQADSVSALTNGGDFIDGTLTNFTITSTTFTGGTSTNLTLVTPSLGGNLKTNDFWLSNDGDDEGIFIDTDGNVGIGTSTPSDLLSIAGGAIYLEDFVPGGSTTNRIHAAGGSLYWSGGIIAGATVGTWDTDGTHVYRQTGSVGIGTTNPSSLFDVVADADSVEGISIENSNTGVNAATSLIFKNDTGTIGGLSVGGSNYFNPLSQSRLQLSSLNGTDIAALNDDIRFYTAGDSASDERLRITNAGNVGIGTTTPSSLLTVAGNGLFSGTLTASNFSGTASGTNTGDVTLAGENYLSLLGQQITASPIDLSGTNATGTLASARVLGSYTGITGLGTITTGVWQGIAIADAYIADDITLTNLTQITNRAISDTTGTLAVARGGTGVTTSTGSGSVVLSTSPTLVTPILGTPTSVTLTNATGLPVSTGISGLGTGVATALGINIGTAGSFITNGGALGTPSSGTLTNATGLPIIAGTTGTLSVARGGTGATTLTGLLLGNGTSAFTATTTLSSSYIADDYVLNTGDSISGNLTFSGTSANIALGSNYLSGDGGDEGVFVSSTGNVGIGTTTPSGKFVISGSIGDVIFGSTGSDVNFTRAGINYLTAQDASGSLQFRTGGSNTRLNIDSTGNFSVNSNQLYVQQSSGNVGIGTTTPSTKLSVASGHISVDNTYSMQFRDNLGANTGLDIRVNSSNTAILKTGTTDGNGLAITSTGNVGIGTTNPGTPLHVFTGLSGFTGFSDVTNGSIAFGNSNASDPSPTIYGRSNSVQGLRLIGLTSDSNTTGDINFDARENDNTNFATLTSSAFRFTRFGTDLVNILRNGNVGIGTTSPATTLDVNGTIRGTGSIPPSSGAGVEIIYASGEGYITAFDRTGVVYKPLRLRGDDLIFQEGATEVMRINGGNVGIGTTSPGYLLDVNGTAHATVGAFGVAPVAGFALNVGSSGLYIPALAQINWGNGNGSITVGGGTDYRMMFKTWDGAANTEHLSILGTGNVGIGTTNPSSFKLQVAGNVGPNADNTYTLGAVGSDWECVYYEGGNLGTCASDRNLKTNITDLTFGEAEDSALEKLARLQVRSFEYKAALGDAYNGLIAQEVREAGLESLVTERPNGFLAVKYGDLQWVIIEAIQDLWSKVTEYFARTEQLEEEVETLRARIEALESGNTYVPPESNQEEDDEQEDNSGADETEEESSEEGDGTEEGTEVVDVEDVGEGEEDATDTDEDATEEATETPAEEGVGDEGLIATDDSQSESTSNVAGETDTSSDETEEVIDDLEGEAGQ